MLRRAVLTSTLIALAAFAQAPNVSRPLVDCDEKELARIVPGWAQLQRANTDATDALRRAGTTLDAAYVAYANVRFEEQAELTRVNDQTLRVMHRNEAYVYTARIAPSSEDGQLIEERTTPGTNKRVAAQRTDGYLLASALVEPIAFLLTPNQAHFRFRALGATADGALVVAFSPADAKAFKSHLQLRNNTPPEPLEGLAWIDVKSARVTRIRLMFADAASDAAVRRASIDTAYVGVRFDSIGATLPLPAHVVVEAHIRGGLVHALHRFSAYRLDGLDDDGDAAQARRNVGEPTSSAVAVDDTISLLVRHGEALRTAGNPGAALEPLRTVVERRPDLAIAHALLAHALSESGDKSAAEREFEQAAQLAPDSPALHNELGLLAYLRGDNDSARTRFLRAVELAPNDAALHVNLANTLRRLNDMDAALAAYRKALELAPGDERIKQAIDALEAAAMAQATIRVEVKQVVVPVVVTAGDGTTVKSLTRADFRVFENGVEQIITAFNAEQPQSAPAAPAASSSRAESAPAAPAAPATRPRRSYVVAVDTLNTDTTDLTLARAALEKVFAEERTGDAEYAVVAVGRSIQVIQNTTRNPAEVLAALDAKAFQKYVTTSIATQRQAELRDFRMELDRARGVCDRREPSCPAMRASARSHARVMGMEQHALVRDYLRLLRMLVDQLGRGATRRVMMLVSGGVSATPARAPNELLYTYFPNMVDARMEGIDRVQDELDAIYRAAARVNVPIYTIDARGLYVNDAMQAMNGGGNLNLLGDVMRTLNNLQSDAGATLDEMAAATGGTAYKNTNDLKTAFQKAMAEGREYYQLAYTSTNTKQDGRYRKIRVEVARKGVTTKAKRGYWADAPPNEKTDAKAKEKR